MAKQTDGDTTAVMETENWRRRIDKEVASAREFPEEYGYMVKVHAPKHEPGMRPTLDSLDEFTREQYKRLYICKRQHMQVKHRLSAALPALPSPSSTRNIRYPRVNLPEGVAPPKHDAALARAATLNRLNQRKLNLEDNQATPRRRRELVSQAYGMGPTLEVMDMKWGMAR